MPLLETCLFLPLPEWSHLHVWTNASSLLWHSILSTHSGPVRTLAPEFSVGKLDLLFIRDTGLKLWLFFFTQYSWEWGTLLLTDNCFSQSNYSHSEDIVYIRNTLEKPAAWEGLINCDKFLWQDLPPLSQAAVFWLRVSTRDSDILSFWIGLSCNLLSITSL